MEPETMPVAKNWLLALLAVGLLSASACSSSDNNHGGNVPQDASSDAAHEAGPSDAHVDSAPPDAAADSAPAVTDASPSNMTDAPVGYDAGDAEAGACEFATFVKGLIANDTTATAIPSTDLGQNCADSRNQADFQSLFP